MRILIEPSITVEDEGEEFILDINSDGINKEEVISNIISALRTIYYVPQGNVQRTIEPLGYTSFFTIDTLPDETYNNIEEWIHNYRVINEDGRIYRPNQFNGTINVNVGGENFKGQLRFNEFIKVDEYGELSDEDCNILQNKGKDFTRLDLSNVVFNSTNYEGADFFKTNLEGSCFDYAYMPCAKFVKTNLIRSTFIGAGIVRANFTDADITGADLSFADLSYANFTGADITGANLSFADLRYANFTDVTFNGETKFDSSIVDDLTITLPEDLVQAILSYEVEDEFADIQYEPIEEDQERLAPLEIDPDQPINEGVSGNTYGELVKLLAPSNTKKVKLPISRMEMDKWYGISSIGNTSPDVWSQLNVVEPLIGKVFQCIFVPEQQEGESMVYETVAPCMAVHSIAGGLDKRQIIQFFDATMAQDKTESAYDTLVSNYPDPNEQLNYLSKEFFNFLMSRLGKHNADETEDSWTHVYDDIELRKTLVKHAIFHVEEGIKNHPFFDKTNRYSGPEFFLLIQEFLKVLPIQVQVVWAQNYIQEFITGYGQTLDTFDPTLRSPEEFIASCLNGNLEKLLISIVTGVTHFYKSEREIEGEEQEQERLLDALLGSEFQNYYGELIDEGPTLDGFIKHIKEGPIISENDREKYIEILNDPNYKRQIEDNINVYTGGRRRKHNTRKYIKKRKAIKGTKNIIKQMKKIKTIKGTKNIKGKNTLKKGKHIKRRKTIKRKKTIKRTIK